MKGNWKTCTLSELGQIVGGATPSTKVSENYENGTIAWLTPKDLAGYNKRYISHGERNITEQGLKSCSAQLMPKHSVLFTSRAPIGYVAIAENPMCTNQGFKSIVPNENTDYMFLYYLLRYMKDAIDNLGSGTTFKEVSGTTMRNVSVSVPDLTTQRKITAVLKSLDDKIELNNKINENLEQQAQAIYAYYVQTKTSIKQTVKDVVVSANTGADAIQKAPIVNYDTGIKCARVGDMTNKRTPWEWGFTNVSDNVFRQYQLKKDDILVSRTAVLGLSAFVHSDISAVYNNGLIRIIANSIKIKPLLGTSINSIKRCKFSKI